jgi:hypothetical protein
MQHTDPPEAVDDRVDCGPSLPPWTLVTSHGLVLLYLAANPDVAMREVAERLGLSERRVVDVIKDLEEAGFVRVTHTNRRNHYSLNPDATFRHPVIARIAFADFLELWRLSEGPREPKPQDSSVEH